MKITREWLHANKTINGGWTKKQLQAIGVQWPPKRNWISSVDGLEISDENAAIFMGTNTVVDAD